MHLKSLTLLLLPLLHQTTAQLEDEPQEYLNSTHNNNQLSLSSLFPSDSLSPRAFACALGYEGCTKATTKCCPSTKDCCGEFACADSSEDCCSNGRICAAGFKCCEGTNGCAPVDGECCDGGFYCRAGKRCASTNGQKLCCAPSGCTERERGGEDEWGLGEQTGGYNATMSMEAPTTTTITRVVDDVLYAGTISWTYWSYYWTSFYPYTQRTVTSTETTTYTVFSVFAKNSAEAVSWILAESSKYNFQPPFTATYLSASTHPASLYTVTEAAAPTATSLSSSDTGLHNGVEPGEDNGVIPGTGAPGGAAGLRISGTGVLVAILIAAVGGLAFGL
ncbi:uncharacterized protein N7515_003292 [Penicillium bovifimosum]|uniref:GPI anchored protein n=1 Tax=Penicillium bovifimosum TaxID=126998 RepID=A0A9W9H4F0_9EURO|nr:uncharacterized protein N7515_003292 [Penicillium bovifimosum]KAJ5138444.1 hypothetical protein N7515_003292 [Penicillium bovifimosum]